MPGDAVLATHEPMRVMIIEDDDETAYFLERSLQEHNWAVLRFADPKAAMLRLGGEAFDAIILDRMLPGMDGLDALKLLRAANITTPVIMLTARSGIDDRVDGLDAGADDYLVKPFAMSELLARLRSLVRRPPIVAEETLLEVGDLQLNRVTRAVSRAGTPLDLSPLEFKLLDCLMSNVGAVATRTMLLEKVWGYNFDPKTSLVQTHMSRLRAKVDKDFEHEMIATVRGVGYVLTAP